MGASMDLATLSAIAQIVGSVAVLITLIYLAVQTRQNTLAIRAPARYAVLSEEMALFRNAMDHPDVIQGILGRLPNLTDHDLIRLGSYLRSLVRTREIHWFQYRNGVIDETTWISYRHGMGVLLSSEVTRQ